MSHMSATYLAIHEVHSHFVPKIVEIGSILFLSKDIYSIVKDHYKLVNLILDVFGYSEDVAQHTDPAVTLARLTFANRIQLLMHYYSIFRHVPILQLPLKVTMPELKWLEQRLIELELSAKVLTAHTEPAKLEESLVAVIGEYRQKYALALRSHKSPDTFFSSVSDCGNSNGQDSFIDMDIDYESSVSPPPRPRQLPNHRPLSPPTTPHHTPAVRTATPHLAPAPIPQPPLPSSVELTEQETPNEPNINREFEDEFGVVKDRYEDKLRLFEFTLLEGKHKNKRVTLVYFNGNNARVLDVVTEDSFYISFRTRICLHVHTPAVHAATPHLAPAPIPQPPLPSSIELAKQETPNEPNINREFEDKFGVIKDRYEDKLCLFEFTLLEGKHKNKRVTLVYFNGGNARVLDVVTGDSFYISFRTRICLHDGVKADPWFMKQNSLAHFRDTLGKKFKDFNFTIVGGEYDGQQCALSYFNGDNAEVLSIATGDSFCIPNTVQVKAYLPHTQ